MSKPSRIRYEDWLYAYNKIQWNNRKLRSEKYGFWLIFRPLREIDDTWTLIKDATERGLLGPMSSVSTKGNNFNQRTGRNYANKVICVFTFDYRNYQDVKRVHRELKRLGFSGELCYKTYEAKHDPEEYFANHGCLYKYRWW